MLIGLVLDAEGFPKGHKVFAGNRPDITTMDEMLGVGVDGAQTLALCWSEGRTLKDRAIRESAGTFLSRHRKPANVASLRAKIHKAIRRLKERTAAQRAS